MARIVEKYTQTDPNLITKSGFLRIAKLAVNSVGPGDSMDYRGLDDAQVRAGAAIRIGLGSTIWVHGYGRRIGTLAGYVSGPALSLDDWKEGPSYGRSWKAVARALGLVNAPRGAVWRIGRGQLLSAGCRT